MLSLFVPNHNSPNIPTLLIGSFSFADLGHCCRPGGPVCEGGAAALGPEDDPQVPRSQRAGLHPVMAGWARLQCHHPQKQVNLFFCKSKMLQRGSFVIGKPQITTETPVKEVTDSAATKSFSLSATAAVERHNNTKIGQSHNFQLITAAAWQFGQMLLLLGCSRL